MAGVGVSVHAPDEGPITVTLAGPADQSVFEAAIKAITFENDTGDPAEVVRNIDVTIEDEGGLSASASTSIVVTQAPTLSVSDISVSEPEAVVSGFATVTGTIQSTGNDTSVDHWTFTHNGGSLIIDAGTTVDRVRFTTSHPKDFSEALIDAVARLHVDRDLLRTVAEGSAPDRGRALGDDRVEHAPAVQLNDRRAHQGVGRQHVGAIAAPLDDKDPRTGTSQQHRSRGSGTPSADDNEIEVTPVSTRSLHCSSPPHAALRLNCVVM